MKKVFSLFPIFFLFAFILAACSEIALNEDGKSSVVGSENAVADCSIVANVNKSNSRGILFINDANTKYYKISALGLSKNILAEDFIERTFEDDGGNQDETTELKLTNLYPDLYIVSVSAYNENKTFLASDVQNVQLLPGDTKTVAFSLKEGFVESTKNIMLWQNASTRGGYSAREDSVKRFVKAFPIVDENISFLDKTIINPGNDDLIYDISNYDFIDSWSASDPFSGTKFIEDMNGILYTVDSGSWYDGEEYVSCFYLYAKYSPTSDWVRVCKIDKDAYSVSCGSYLSIDENLILSYDFSKNSLYLIGLCNQEGKNVVCLAEIDLYNVSNNIDIDDPQEYLLSEIGYIEQPDNTRFTVTAFSVSGSDAYLGFVAEDYTDYDNKKYSYTIGKFPFTYVSYGEYGEFIKDENKTQEVSPVTDLSSGLSGAVTDIVTYGGKTYVLVCESFNTPGSEYDSGSYTGTRYTNEISNFINSESDENVYATFFSRGALIELKTDSLQADKILGWTSDSEKRSLQPKGSLDDYRDDDGNLPDSYKGLAKELAGCDLYAPTTATAKNKFWGPRKIVAVRPKELYIVDNGYNIRLADWRGAEKGGETGQLFNEGTGETYTSKFTTGNMFVHDRIVKVDIEKFVFSDKYEETSVKFGSMIYASSGPVTKENFDELYNTFHFSTSSYPPSPKNNFALTCKSNWFSDDEVLLSVPTQNEEHAK